jgi:hypothetical protein
MIRAIRMRMRGPGQPHTDEVKPIWTTSSFLVYTGGLTVLFAAVLGLAYLSTQHGGFGRAAWAFLFLVILYGFAIALFLRGRMLAAGIFAFASVIAWGAFIAFLFTWFGFHGVTGSLSHWSLARLVLWLLVLSAAWTDRFVFRFPFIAVIVAVVQWLFVIDLVRATPNHPNWMAIVSLLFGLMYLGVGVVDGSPSAFWFHLVGGLLVSGAILYWFHTSNFDYAVVSFVAFVYVGIAYATKRSSWAFLGTIGFFAATSHYLIGSPTAIVQGIFGASQTCTSTGGLGPLCVSTGPQVSPWAPALAFGLLGLWLVLLGLPARRHHDTQAAAPLAPVVE